MINLNDLLTAVRIRLKSDATLAGLIGDVYRGAIPSVAIWSKPNIEIGIQADPQDQETSYGTRSQIPLVRLMAHDKGAKPGVGSYARCYAVLVRAETVLLTAPLTVSGMVITDLRRDSGIPEAMPIDTSGYRRMQVGNLYRFKVDEA